MEGVYIDPTIHILFRIVYCVLPFLPSFSYSSSDAFCSSARVAISVQCRAIQTYNYSFYTIENIMFPLVPLLFSSVPTCHSRKFLS